MKDRTIIRWLFARSRKQAVNVVLLAALNMLTAVLGILTALFNKNVIDAAVSGPGGALIEKALYLLGLILLRICLSFLARNFSGITEDRMTMELRSYMMDTFLKQDYGEISRRHTGELMTRITSDVNIISSNVVTLIPSVLQFLTRMICAFLVLYRLDHGFALTILVAGGILFLLIQPVRPFMKRMHRQVQEKEGKLRSFMQEILESQLVIRVFHVEKQAQKRLDVLQKDSYRIRRKRRWLINGANMGIQLMFQMGYLYALVWSAYHLGNGTISVGMLTAVLQLVNQIQNPLMNLSGVLPGVFAVLASGERLMEMERKSSEKSMETDGKNGTERNAEEAAETGFSGSLSVEKLYREMEAIEVQDVTFSYDEESENVLEHAGFSLNRKEFATVVGPSGIGKSTLIRLLLGIYPLKTGKIGIRLTDGSFVEMSDRLRGLYAYVPQGNCLFSGTIRETVCFFRESISEEAIWRALQISCADEFVDALPQKLDTVIGERGLGLSEGQLQRLAIARALLSDAPVLLLDEATSALDEQTELRLLKNLQLLEDKTCLFITHRAAANSICTKVIRVCDKKLVAAVGKNLSAAAEKEPDSRGRGGNKQCRLERKQIC